MDTKTIVQGISAIVLTAAVMAAFFISPFNVAAANTHSITLVRGSSQYLSASDSGSLSFSDNITLETWVKFTSLPSGGGDSMNFMSHWDSSSNNKGFLWRLRENSGSYVLDWSNSSDGTTDDLVSVSWAPSTNTWYHVAVTFASGSVKFYVNGVQQGTTQTSSKTSIYNASSNFNVGSLQGANDIMDGKLDDGRVWSLVKDSTQISDDMSRELNGNESGLSAYWKFNNDSGLDSSSNGNGLTASGGPSYSSDTPFVGFAETLKVRKNSNESLANSTTLQNDDQLKLGLASNTTYIIDGVIFASSTSATPDIDIGFFGQSGVDLAIGYTNDVNEMVLSSGEVSNRIALPANTPTSIHIHGTVKTGSTSGDFQLKWAQATSNGSPTTVMKGSYLRAEAI